MGKICIIKVGNFVDGLINVISFGWGKSLAGWVSLKFFNNPDCGCEKRRIFLNEFFGCKEQIKLF
jgi:hypothetical protein